MLFRSLPALPGWLVERRGEAQTPTQSAERLALTLLMIGVGFGVEWLFVSAVASVRNRLDADQAAAPMHMGLWLMRVALDVLRIGVFALASAAALLVANQGQIATRRAALVAIATIAVVRLAVRLLRLILAPKPGAVRLVRLDDAAAAAVYRWTLRIGLVTLIGTFVIDLLSTLGLAEPTVRLLSLALCIAMLSLILVAIRRAHMPVAERLKAAAGEQHRILQHLADFWHIPAILYVLLVAVLWLLNLLSGGSRRLGAGVMTLLILLLYPALLRAFRAVAGR